MVTLLRLQFKHGESIGTEIRSQRGVDPEVKRPYTKRRGSECSFYLHLAVSIHERCRAPPPPPPLRSSVLDLGRLEGAARCRVDPH